MAKKTTLQKIGGWSFIVGIILAIIISLMAAFDSTTPMWAVILLAVLGLIVGFLNITPEEALPFLVATVAFLLSFGVLQGLANLLGTVGTGIATFFELMQIFVAPSAAIVGLFAILAFVRD